MEHDVFISYTGSDSSHAERVYGDLRRYGANIWFDKFSMPVDHGYEAGQIRSLLIKSMADSKALLLLVSARSLASRWVRFELDTAIALEARDSSRRIVTLMVGRGSERDIPESLASRRRFDLRDNFEARLRLYRPEIFRNILEPFEPWRYRRAFG